MIATLHIWECAAGHELTIDDGGTPKLAKSIIEHTHKTIGAVTCEYMAEGSYMPCGAVVSYHAAKELR